MGKGIASLGWLKKDRAFFELATLDLLTERIGLFRALKFRMNSFHFELQSQQAIAR
jgi:hypothetical protein